MLPIKKRQALFYRAFHTLLNAHFYGSLIARYFSAIKAGNFFTGENIHHSLCRLVMLKLFFALQFFTYLVYG